MYNMSKIWLKLGVCEWLFSSILDRIVYEPNSGGFIIDRGYLRYPLREESDSNVRQLR